MSYDVGKNDLQKTDQEKEAAARASLQYVQDGQVVGLGTGSTAAYFIKLLGERVKNGLKIRGLPTSAHLVHTQRLTDEVVGEAHVAGCERGVRCVHAAGAELLRVGGPI